MGGGFSGLFLLVLAKWDEREREREIALIFERKSASVPGGQEGGDGGCFQVQAVCSLRSRLYFTGCAEFEHKVE